MHEYPLITTIAAAFTAAWLLGLITQRLRLSPIVGYLLAGVLIGPFTPGFVGDAKLAPQLAEIGVILLMFGVGLHFHLKDLLAVRTVAIPGAIGQSLVATLLGLAVAAAFGMSMKTGLVLGMSMAVASTVVLIRGLTDNRLLDSTAGHVAVGWLIVEDIFTVVLLVVLSAIGGGAVDAAARGAGEAAGSVWTSLALAVGKLALLMVLLLKGGAYVIPRVMEQVARLRSRELFTLTVLVMAIAIAAASYKLFGASMALGAFLAGMVVAQSAVSQQAAADALPLRDAFAVLFFVSVGMLFDPGFVVREPALLLAGLGIVLIGKPIAALVIVAVIGYPLRTGLVVAMGLAQVGEFSFILSEVARGHNLMDDTGHHLIVACAIVSITINPFLFRLVDPLERWARSRPALWRLLNGRSERECNAMNADTAEQLNAAATADKRLAVVVGYGPVGRTVDAMLRKAGVETVIADLNMDTIQALKKEGRLAVFGDAYNVEVLLGTLAKATHLIITLPHGVNRAALISAAKSSNPAIKVFVRARYVAERDELIRVGADAACFEEAESAAALARLVLSESGVESELIQQQSSQIRRDLGAEIR